MKIVLEKSLRNFEFWSGGRDRAVLLTLEELDLVEQMFEDMYPEGMTDTEINDIFWFSFDEVLEWLGLTEDEVDERWVE